MEFEHQQNSNKQPIEFLTYFVRIDGECENDKVADKIKEWKKARGIIVINDIYKINSSDGKFDPNDIELDPKQSLSDAVIAAELIQVNVEPYVSVLGFSASTVCDIIDSLPNITRFEIAPTKKQEFKEFSIDINSHYDKRPSRFNCRSFTAWIVTDMRTNLYQLHILPGYPYTRVPV